MAFVRTAKTNEITPGTIREFQVEGKTVALANIGGKYYAINNTCLHRGGPLGQGVLNGTIVTCPWHGWEYDVATGKVKQNPAVGVDCYPVEVRGEDIRSEEHTSELQSLAYLVCRLLLEKKKQTIYSVKYMIYL